MEVFKNIVNFARIPKILDLPDMVEMQKKSYKSFLQVDISANKREMQGLQAAFLDIFPVANSDESLVLDFVDYTLDPPKYSEDEAIEKDVTYTLSLKANMRLTQRDASGKVKQITEQEVFLCDLPMITQNATFIFNGAERVIVSQMHRSPGVIFEEDEEKMISSFGKKLFFARIIPYRGAWVEFEYDLNNILYVRIDKKRKILATTLLRALGYESNETILNLFYKKEKKALTKNVINMHLAEDAIDKNTGEILMEAGNLILPEKFEILKLRGIKDVSVIIFPENINDITIINTLAKDNFRNANDAIFDIYKKLRAQEFISAEQAKNFIYNMLFNSIKKYDLTKVGRYKINKKLEKIFDEFKKNKVLEMPTEDVRVLTRVDVVATIKYLINLNNEVSGEIDDIDHLGNRRIRSVGELLENQIRVGLSHMARLIREKMNMQDRDKLTVRSLVNAAPLVGIIRKFFGTSQLSQFMDQVNPLAELTHKRRLSALGPGGLNRKRAGFEIRDVHYTHYGRVCPVETPEGQNIGLITSLSCYSKVNDYGLIETPYRKIKNGKVTDEISYLTANEEEGLRVAQANSPIDKNGNLTGDLVACRYADNFPLLPKSAVEYMDISPIQVVSPSTALIPFLEHDDANRALMGANMQRQAVPLMITQKPVVATGIEDVVAKDSGATIIARQDGVVLSVTSNKIIIWSDAKKNDSIEIYKLKKYNRSNQDTSINQIPLVKFGDRVKQGDVIADGAATDKGQLALGKNLLVAFMPWEGYNFEDAILLNQKLVKEDVLTSIHITEFNVEARDLKIGVEEITRDIPNIGEEALKNLDENGIIRIGAEVEAGDILVGKVTPKGEQLTTPEERLLKVIFGKKAEDVQDASLRVTPGVRGKVLDVKVLSRSKKMTKKEEAKFVKKLEEKYNEMFANLKKEKDQKVKDLKAEKNFDKKYLEMINKFYEYQEQDLKQKLANEKDKINKDDELPITVNKIVKVLIASRRKISVGDKMAGRHGNKGIVAKIMKQEDMPYLPDGRPVDIVLSPLAIPSRMNVGQIMETILGWAGVNLDTQMVTPVFDGATEDDIKENIKKAKKNLMKNKNYKEEYLPDEYCRTTLYDGRTGETFNEKITVGYMYMLKLSHLVEDKIHARSTGPYSLITRQPLGGKAQFGGQRVGEMEVWAIEGYGASHILQEFLTVKSDDVNGRTKMYESIIKGEIMTDPGIPESFKVLVKELQSLCLNIELLKENN